mmetsp:Transcript_668/g.1939  ORF Transcript_668/g.1939 Transcript_668/m.1939 type:complete len:261 (-) Transcript_668:244-1026(-)
MLSSISPWASTSTAMSMKIWCKSSSDRSRSCTASCRSRISAMVSATCPRPCSMMARWKMRSDSPVSISCSTSEGLASRPVTVYTRRPTVSLYSFLRRVLRAWNSFISSTSFCRSAPVVADRMRSLLLPGPHFGCCSALWLSFSSFSSRALMPRASLLTWLTFSCILLRTTLISSLRVMTLLRSLSASRSFWISRIPANRSLMAATCPKKSSSILSCESDGGAVGGPSKRGGGCGAPPGPPFTLPSRSFMVPGTQGPAWPL